MTTAADLGITEHQYQNLLGYIRAVNSRPATRGSIKAAYIITCAALAESGMRMLANPNVPKSLDLTHDGLGYDHASIGSLQQQTGYDWVPAGYAPAGKASMQQTTMNSPDGWGTPVELMDPTYSANKFFEVLEARTTWETDTLPWLTIQSVQGSFDPTGGNYKAQWNEALRLVNAVWGQAPSTDTSTELGGFLMALSDKDQQFILDEAKWWYSRRAKFDKMAWTVSNLANAIKGVVIGVQAIARKLGVK